MCVALMDLPSSLNHKLAVVGDHITQLSAEPAHAHARRRIPSTQCNAFNPLCRLPTEILHKILGILVYDGHQSAWDVLESPARLGWDVVQSNTDWTQVMLVCSHLRRLAIESPLLWTRIHVTRQNEKWVQLCAERAGSAPKILSIGEERWTKPGYYHWTLLLQSLMDSAADLRIRLNDRDFLPWQYAILGLAVSLPPPDIEDSLFSLDDRNQSVIKRLEQPMPSLECLQLVFPQSHPFYLGSGFLGGRTSLLTQLTLSEVYIGIDLPALPALLDLNLRGVWAHSLQQLMAFVNSSPRIQRLALHRVCLIEPPTKDDSMPTVHLAQLQVLVVWCDAEVLHRILPLLPSPCESGVVGYTHKRSCGQDTRRQIMQEARRLISAPEDSYPGTGDIYADDAAWRVLAEDVFVLAGGSGRDHNLLALSPARDFACRPQRMHIRDTDAGAVCGRLLALFSSQMRVADVVIERGTGDLAPLRRWLAERYSPIASLDFRACPGYAAQYGSIVQLGQELVDARLVCAVLEDGLGVAVARSMPRRSRGATRQTTKKSRMGVGAYLRRMGR
jgi:hypothetical protein